MKHFLFSVHAGSPTVAWGCCGRAPQSPIRLYTSQGWSLVRDADMDAENHHIVCLLWLYSVDDILVCAGKYGSNIRPAFWRNIPFFLVPFWAASLLFSRPREMPIVTADKVSFRNEDIYNILCIYRVLLSDPFPLRLSQKEDHFYVFFLTLVIILQPLP